MTTVFDIRRTNLRKLMETWGGPTSLAAKLGHSNGSYLAQLVGPHPTREVSEKVAREIERKLDLSANWLDHPHRGALKQPNTDDLIDVIALVQDVLDGEGVKLARPKFTELVNLVYEQSNTDGSVNTAHLRRIVKLLK